MGHIGLLDGMYLCDWDVFTVFADVDYDTVCGNQKVNPNLTVCFNDGGWFQRTVDGGHGGWIHYRKPPCKHFLKEVERLRILSKIVNKE